MQIQMPFPVIIYNKLILIANNMDKSSYCHNMYLCQHIRELSQLLKAWILTRLLYKTEKNQPKNMPI